MFTFFYEKLFQNDSAHDYFSLETKWHEIGFYISWIQSYYKSPYSFILLLTFHIGNLKEITEINMCFF